MFQFIKKNKGKTLAIALIVILIIVILGKRKSDEGVATYTVSRKDVSDSLVLSGKVEPIERVEMAFAMSGKVDNVYKKVGDRVYPGEKIIELDNASLRASLADAEAKLSIEKAGADVSNAEIDINVQNALTKLLSDDLVAYTKNSDITDSAPEISGSYNSDIQGEYRIDVEYSNSSSRRSIKYSGLENGQEEILLYKAVPLGTRGLYIKFNEGDVSIGETWRVTIPNVEGDNYTANLNAYNSALASRDAAQKQNISKDINIARIKQAEAQVAKIKADMEERILRATFSGVIGNIDIREGEIAQAGTIVAKVLSEDAYQVVVQVPEVDIVNMVPELVANITLDAYGKDVIFGARVASIDPSETKVDGVSVYEARIVFDVADARVISGLSANVSVLKDKRENVLCVPKRFIDKDETGEFVLVRNLEIEKNDKAYIQTGLIGSDGCVEVLSGVSEGQVLIGEFEK